MLNLKQNVLTPTGEVPIENLKQGDLVVGPHGEIGQIKRIDHFTPKENKFFYVVNGKYAFAPHQSVYASGRLIHARQLSVGHYLELRSGRFIKITSLRKFHDRSPKIKLLIDRPFHILNFLRKNTATHRYYLNGVLVHNASRYWVGGTATWDATAGTKWAASSGGGGGSSVPTSSDDVFFDAGSGAANCTTSGTTTDNCANLNFTGYTGTFTHATSTTVNVYGSLTLVAGMTYTRSSTTSSAFAFRATATGKTITTAGKVLGNITFDGVGGGWTLQDTFSANGSTSTRITLTRGTLDTNGQTVNTGGISSDNSNTRTLTLGASTINLSSTTPIDFTITTGMTLNANTSQINCTSSTSNTFDGGGKTFYNVTFSTPATVVLVGANTFNNFTMTCAAAPDCLLALGSNTTINGTLTLTPNSVLNRLFVASNTINGNVTLTVATLAALSNVDFQGITAAGAAAPFTGTSIGDGGNNSNITSTTPVTRYWVGNAGNWNDTNHWSASSGGAGGASVPLCHDSVRFDGNSFSSASQTVVTNHFMLGKDIDWTGVTNTPTWQVNTVMANRAYHIITGSITLVSGMATSCSQVVNVGVIRVIAQNDITFTTGGISLIKFAFRFYINGSYKVTLVGDYVSDFNTGTSGSLAIGDGEFDANDYDITIKSFTANFSSGPIVRMGNGTWTLSVAASLQVIWSATSASAVYAEGSTLIFDNNLFSTMSIGLGNHTYNDIIITGGGASILTISGSPTINNLTIIAPKTIDFTAGTTTTILGDFIATGSAGNLITLGSTSTTNFILSKSSGIVDCDYLSLSDSTATGGAQWYAGSNSTDAGGGNSGWIFSDAPEPANDERPAKTTGKIETTAERTARLTGYTTTASERSAKLMGVLVDERSAKLTGQALTSSERPAKITGEDTSNSERSARLTGQALTSTEREVKLTGYDTTSSERSSKITGKETVSAERSAKITGEETDTEERSAKLTGQDTAFSERGATLTGQMIDERSARLTGKDTATSERPSKIIGQDTAFSERSGKLTGEATDASERNGKLIGKDTAQSERSAKIIGKDTATSERDTKITGKDTAAIEREATLHGQATANDERNAKITGKDTSTSERSGRLIGGLDIDDERPAKLHGVSTDQSERPAKLTGEITTSNVRDAKLTGKATAQDDRSGKVTGQDADTSERSVMLHGKQDISVERSGRMHGTDTANSNRSGKLTGFLTTNDERIAFLHGKDTAQTTRSGKITGKQAISNERGAKLTGIARIIKSIYVTIRSLAGNVEVSDKKHVITVRAISKNVEIREIEKDVTLRKIADVVEIEKR